MLRATRSANSQREPGDVHIAAQLVELRALPPVPMLPPDLKHQIKSNASASTPPPDSPSSATTTRAASPRVSASRFAMRVSPAPIPTGSAAGAREQDVADAARPLCRDGLDPAATRGSGIAVRACGVRNPSTRDKAASPLSSRQEHGRGGSRRCAEGSPVGPARSAGYLFEARQKTAASILKDRRCPREDADGTVRAGATDTAFDLPPRHQRPGRQGIRASNGPPRGPGLSAPPASLACPSPRSSARGSSPGRPESGRTSTAATRLSRQRGAGSCANSAAPPLLRPRSGPPTAVPWSP